MVLIALLVPVLGMLLMLAMEALEDLMFPPPKAPLEDVDADQPAPEGPMQGGLAMRIMFVVCLLVIAAGLTYAITIGLMRR